MKVGDNETIDGFNILKRTLTEEEQSRDLTFDRIDRFNSVTGEDYLDICSLDTQAEKIFLGFLIAKNPKLSKEILKVANTGYIDCDFYALFSNNNDECQSDDFYRLFCDFVNCTQGLKARVNQVLIQVDEKHRN